MDRRSTVPGPRSGAGMLFGIAVATLFAKDAVALSVKSYVANTDGITFTCDNGVMKVQICQADIVRVAYSPTSTIPARPINVVTKVWPTPTFSTTEVGDTVTLVTSKLKLKVSKSTANVTYADLNDGVILSEGAKSMTPVTVLTANTNTVRAEFMSPSDEGLFGLGQHMDGNYNMKGKTEVMDEDYGSKSTAVSVLVSTRGYGIFWDSYAKVTFDGTVSSNSRYAFSSECGDELSYYFFYGPDIDHVISGYRTATGKVPLFPKWAYGLIQSKDRYMSQAEILAVKNGYRKNNIPLDVIVQDWQYWVGAGQQGCYCFNSGYGNVKNELDSLHNSNIHTLISIWSEIEQGSPPFSSFNANGWLWPSSGTTHFIDSYNSQARETFWNNIKSAMFDTTVLGWDGWWFDNDEPFPYPDNFDRRSVTTAMGLGVLFYNTYSFEMTSMAYSNWRRDIPGKRFVMLHRANFAGQQSHSAIQWSSDINSDFPTLTTSVTSGINSTVSGIPYWTTDIGGYWGANIDFTTDNNQQLMTRWLQYGAFCPIFRIHGNMESGQGRELYSTTFSAATRANLLIADKLRYRLMPYIYSLAWMTTNSDYTPMRHLILDFRTDPNIKTVGNQFMYGPAFMVSPVTTYGTTSRSVYLPAGNWFDFWTGLGVKGGGNITANAPLSQIPLDIRAGSIVPMGPDVQYSTQQADTIELRIYPGADGSFTMYEDENDNYDYETGKYATIPITYVDATKNVIIGDRVGSFSGMVAKKVFNIVFVASNHGAGIGVTAQPDNQLVYTGTQVSLIPTGLTKNQFGADPGSAVLKTSGNLVTFPEAFAGKAKSIAVHDYSGKLVYQGVVRANEVDIRKDLGLAAGDYVVNVKAIR